MTCSKCHTPGHNKRRCLREPTTAGPSASASAGPSSVPGPSSGSGPRKAPAPSGRGRGRPKGSTEKTVATKRPKMVGMGVLHTQSGATIINPGLPSERVRNIKSSAVVTGELQHKASGGVKSQGRDKKQSQTRTKAVQMSQGSTTAV
ncbi:uncharacterized protein LOC132053856 [Lycium ferocissimum]|uniref:uncharacterized protein LOC132053856 n=1 Tax=Lycium ferocissimum TaxID=112874 RepID=UPI00281648D6|nr:uncharacterized protein LOC132053856 [Lycium ferocissimum]